MLQFLKKPLFWLRFISVIICIFGLMKINAIVVPPIVLTIITHIEGSNLFVELAESFNYYIEKTQQYLRIESRVQVIYSFLFSFITSTLFLISGIFSFLRRERARKMIIFLVILMFLNIFVVVLLKGSYKIKLSIDEFIYYIFLIIFFTRRPIVSLFTTKTELKASVTDS